MDGQALSPIKQAGPSPSPPATAGPPFPPAEVTSSSASSEFDLRDSSSLSLSFHLTRPLEAPVESFAPDRRAARDSSRASLPGEARRGATRAATRLSSRSGGGAATPLAWRIGLTTPGGTFESEVDADSTVQTAVTTPPAARGSVSGSSSQLSGGDGDVALPSFTTSSSSSSSSSPAPIAARAEHRTLPVEVVGEGAAAASSLVDSPSRSDSGEKEEALDADIPAAAAAGHRGIAETLRSVSAARKAQAFTRRIAAGVAARIDDGRNTIAQEEFQARVALHTRHRLAPPSPAPTVPTESVSSFAAAMDGAICSRLRSLQVEAMLRDEVVGTRIDSSSSSSDNVEGFGEQEQSDEFVDDLEDDVFSPLLLEAENGEAESRAGIRQEAAAAAASLWAHTARLSVQSAEAHDRLRVESESAATLWGACLLPAIRRREALHREYLASVATVVLRELAARASVQAAAIIEQATAWPSLRMSHIAALLQLVDLGESHGRRAITTREHADHLALLLCAAAEPLSRTQFVDAEERLCREMLVRAFVVGCEERRRRRGVVAAFLVIAEQIARREVAAGAAADMEMAARCALEHVEHQQHQRAAVEAQMLHAFAANVDGAANCEWLEGVAASAENRFMQRALLEHHHECEGRGRIVRVEAVEGEILSIALSERRAFMDTILREWVLERRALLLFHTLVPSLQRVVLASEHAQREAVLEREWPRVVLAGTALAEMDATRGAERRAAVALFASAREVLCATRQRELSVRIQELEWEEARRRVAVAKSELRAFTDVFVIPVYGRALENDERRARHELEAAQAAARFDELGRHFVVGAWVIALHAVWDDEEFHRYDLELMHVVQEEDKARRFIATCVEPPEFHRTFAMQRDCLEEKRTMWQQQGFSAPLFAFLACTFPSAVAQCQQAAADDHANCLVPASQRLRLVLEEEQQRGFSRGREAAAWLVDVMEPLERGERIRLPEACARAQLLVLSFFAVRENWLRCRLFGTCVAIAAFMWRRLRPALANLLLHEADSRRTLFISMRLAEVQLLEREIRGAVIEEPYSDEVRELQRYSLCSVVEVAARGAIERHFFESSNHRALAATLREEEAHRAFWVAQGQGEQCRLVLLEKHEPIGRASLMASVAAQHAGELEEARSKLLQCVADLQRRDFTVAAARSRWERIVIHEVADSEELRRSFIDGLQDRLRMSDLYAPFRAVARRLALAEREERRRFAVEAREYFAVGIMWFDAGAEQALLEADAAQRRLFEEFACRSVLCPVENRARAAIELEEAQHLVCLEEAGARSGLGLAEWGPQSASAAAQRGWVEGLERLHRLSVIEATECVAAEALTRIFCSSALEAAARSCILQATVVCEERLFRAPFDVAAAEAAGAMLLDGVELHEAAAREHLSGVAVARFHAAAHLEALALAAAWHTALLESMIRAEAVAVASVQAHELRCGALLAAERAARRKLSRRRGRFAEVAAAHCAALAIEHAEERRRLRIGVRALLKAERLFRGAGFGDVVAAGWLVPLHSTWNLLRLEAEEEAARAVVGGAMLAAHNRGLRDTLQQAEQRVHRAAMENAEVFLRFEQLSCAAQRLQLCAAEEAERAQVRADASREWHVSVLPEWRVALAQHLLLDFTVGPQQRAARAHLEHQQELQRHGVSCIWFEREKEFVLKIAEHERRVRKEITSVRDLWIHGVAAEALAREGVVRHIRNEFEALRRHFAYQFFILFELLPRCRRLRLPFPNNMTAARLLLSPAAAFLSGSSPAAPSAAAAVKRRHSGFQRAGATLPQARARGVKAQRAAKSVSAQEECRRQWVTKVRLRVRSRRAQMQEAADNIRYRRARMAAKLGRVLAGFAVRRGIMLHLRLAAAALGGFARMWRAKKEVARIRRAAAAGEHAAATTQSTRLVLRLVYFLPQIAASAHAILSQGIRRERQRQQQLRALVVIRDHLGAILAARKQLRALRCGREENDAEWDAYEEGLAATVSIQALFRGKRARRVATALRCNRVRVSASRERAEQRRWAATVLQALWRSRHASRQFGAHQRLERLLDAKARARRRREAAASRLQCWWRWRRACSMRHARAQQGAPAAASPTVSHIAAAPSRSSSLDASPFLARTRHSDAATRLITQPLRHLGATSAARARQAPPRRVTAGAERRLDAMRHGAPLRSWDDAAGPPEMPFLEARSVPDVAQAAARSHPRYRRMCRGDDHLVMDVDAMHAAVHEAVGSWAARLQLRVQLQRPRAAGLVDCGPHAKPRPRPAKFHSRFLDATATAEGLAAGAAGETEVGPVAAAAAPTPTAAQLPSPVGRSPDRTRRATLASRSLSAASVSERSRGASLATSDVSRTD